MGRRWPLGWRRQMAPPTQLMRVWGGWDCTLGAECARCSPTFEQGGFTANLFGGLPIMYTMLEEGFVELHVKISPSGSEQVQMPATGLRTLRTLVCLLFS